VPLLADYEGLNAAFGLIFGLIVMAPPFFLSVAGAVEGNGCHWLRQCSLDTRFRTHSAWSLHQLAPTFPLASAAVL